MQAVTSQCILDSQSNANLNDDIVESIKMIKANAEIMKIKTNSKNIENVFGDALSNFNHHMHVLNMSGFFNLVENTVNSYELTEHILEQAYSRAVAQYADTLRVRGFKNTAYGEVKCKLVNQFIVKTKLHRGHVFLDLGSGIGNVVMQGIPYS